MTADHKELEEIVDKYHKTLDLVTIQLRQKENLCTTLQEQNRRLDAILLDTIRISSASND